MNNNKADIKFVQRLHQQQFGPWKNPFDINDHSDLPLICHPYTCGNRGDGNHFNDGILVPTVRGWICQSCDYTQPYRNEVMF